MFVSVMLGVRGPQCFAPAVPQGKLAARSHATGPCGIPLCSAAYLVTTGGSKKDGVMRQPRQVSEGCSVAGCTARFLGVWGVSVSER